MKIRDSAERLAWTLLAAFLGALSVGGLLDISTLDAAIAAAASAGVNFLLLVARARLAVLPEPGEGLPGLPTHDTVSIAERLGLPYDPEPSTRDRGAGELDLVVKVLVIVLLVVVILALI